MLCTYLGHFFSFFAEHASSTREDNLFTCVCVCVYRGGGAFLWCTRTGRNDSFWQQASPPGKTGQERGSIPLVKIWGIGKGVMCGMPRGVCGKRLSCKRIRFEKNGYKIILFPQRWAPHIRFTRVKIPCNVILQYLFHQSFQLTSSVIFRTR